MKTAFLFSQSESSIIIIIILFLKVLYFHGSNKNSANQSFPYFKDPFNTATLLIIILK